MEKQTPLNCFEDNPRFFLSSLKRNSQAQPFCPDLRGICEQVDCEPAPDNLSQEGKISAHLVFPSATLFVVFQ